ncbi:MAG: 6-phosphogluconolactonase [Promicromonosporaceae bacterium]|nr:6-phosphogluconolactonase [Promicromonosporaceae bacterium]
MDTGTFVVVHPDAQTLAEATAARLLITLLDAQSAATPLHVSLTGGTVGVAVLAAAAKSPVLAAIDWSGVHLWWSDERYLSTGDPERNETQARAALLDLLVAGHGLPAANIHPIPGPDSVSCAEEAARNYAAELASWAESEGWGVPEFDVSLLGVGSDGHVASLFPGHPALNETGTVVAVHDSPKPPSVRVSLTVTGICASQEVWFVAAGPEKAEQIAAALADDTTVPAAQITAQSCTLWLLDVAAADCP